MMAGRLTAYAAEYLLTHYFSSKKEMAEKLNISYRALLRLCRHEHSERDAQAIMIGIAQFCMKEQIAPEQIFHGFCPI